MFSTFLRATTFSLVSKIVNEVRVECLETLDYLDNMLERERYTEQADAITFDGEVVTNASNVYPKDTEAPPCVVDGCYDKALLSAGVLYNLKCRYDSDEIYVSMA